MKRHILTLTLLLMASIIWAVPAKRGQWKTLQLTDGTEVRAQLGGDEHVHFWQAEDGTRYVLSSTEGDTDYYEPIDNATLAARAKARRSTLKNHMSRRSALRKVTIGERTHYEGQKKGIVILAQYTDKKFQTANNQARYQRVLNEEGYSEGNFKGSVADYFKAQSAGQFELDFDVVGPYTLAHEVSYYGRDSGGEGNDIRAGDMIVEACKMADEEVNFADYDWDGDGEVDQVFVVYAGKGQADGGASTTIWPHMWVLEEAYGSTLTLDNTVINTYACSSELSGSSIAGIGTFCHEFSHCMGFPDFYDIDYSGWFGMDDFDLMCGGSYLGNGFIPCGYTAHEKMMCGWQEPIVLAETDTVVKNVKPMSDHGETFIIYNDAHPDEYFMLENRQLSGWDADYPARGLMITHVDFDKDIWECNVPNTKVSNSEAYQYGLPAGKGNNHQRMTIVHADNTESTWNTSTDLYPYRQRDSLTATSTPAAKFYNKNSEGTYLMKGAVLGITQNSDGTMNFTFRSGNAKDDDDPGNDDPGNDDPGNDDPGNDDPGNDDPGNDDPGNDDPGNDDPGNDDPGTDIPEDGVLFYESFDLCQGTGGNDGKWSTTIASSKDFNPDNEGWDALQAYAGYQCARFGNGNTVGVVNTPPITFFGECTLTFKAASWNNDGTDLGLLIYTDNDTEDQQATVTPSAVVMKSFEWDEYTVTINAKGSRKIVFIPSKRFLLDEVLVQMPSSPTAISTVGTTVQPGLIYTLAGRCMGTNAAALRPGIYVRNGKKFVK